MTRMPISGTRLCVSALGAMLLLTAAGVGIAQSCRQQWTVPALSQVIANAKYDDEVYRACAIRGADLRPELRSIARPKSAVLSPAGAAQVCLVRLGDDTALAQLRDELGERLNEGAIFKLARASTPGSLALLMDYVVRRENDRSRIVAIGDDAAYDPISTIWRAIGRFVPGAPDPYVTDSVGFPRGWREWWRQRHAGEAFPPRLETAVPRDSLERCLARKVELGLLLAILDLGDAGGGNVPAAFFRTVAGSDAKPAASTGTIVGMAQTVLAKRGDPQELEKIRAELNTGQYNNALGKIETIGGVSSVGLLVESLDLVNFLGAGRRTLTPESFRQESRRYLIAVFGALNRMVRQPPIPPASAPTPDNVERWKRWWAAGPTADVLLPVRPSARE